MKTRLIAFSCVIVMAAMLAYGQGLDPGYQMARVVSFEKGAANAQHPSDADTYKVSMRMGGVLYICRANAPASAFMDWSMGKEFPARLDGKVLTVKGPNNQIVQLNVLKTKTPK